ncbi:MAG: TolC family protein [Pseudomonadota bacterium]
MRLLLTSALLAASPAALSAQGLAPQNLSGALTDARAHSPALAAAEAEADAAEARVDQARSAGGPSVRVEASIGAGRIDLGGFFGLSADDVTPRVAQLVGEYPLYSGGRVGAAVAQARGGAAAAQAGQMAAESQLTVDVVTSYAEVLTARRLVESYTQLEASLSEVVRQAGLRFRVGDAASTDVAQARARLAEGVAGRVGAEGRLAGAEARLARLTGKPVAELAPLGTLPETPTTLADAIERALSHNPMLAQAEAVVSAAEAGRRAARASRLPSVGAFAEAVTVRDQFFPGYRADSVAVGVRGRWTIIDGGAGSARSREAAAALTAAQARETGASDAITQYAIEAWAGFATAGRMVEAAREGSAAADEALRGTRLEVQVGAKPMLAQLDALREAIAATARLAEAEGMQAVAAYRLRAICGME